MNDRPGELGSDWAHLEYAAGEGFSVGERWRTVDLLRTYELARDACRLTRTTRWYDDAYARVT